MRVKNSRRLLGLVIIGTLLVATLTGTALASPLNIGGEFATNLNLETGDPSYLTSSNQLQIKLSKSLGTASFYSDVNLDGIYGGASGIESVSLELGEAYFDHFAPTYDLRIGRQILTWGTALEINPTDVINPMNIADPMGDKLPVSAVQGTYYPNSVLEVTGVFLPYFKPAVSQAPMPGLTVVKPEATVENSEYALKVRAVGVQGADFSLSYFSGKEDMPTLLNPMAGEASYRDQEIFGADFATAIGDVGLWAEASLAQTEGVVDDYLSWIVGGDYRLSSGLYLVAQYAQMDKGQGETNLVVGAMEQNFAGIHHWKMGTVYNVDSGGYVLLPEVTFSLADSTDLIIGAKFVEDESGSLASLGQTSDQIQAEVKMSF